MDRLIRLPDRPLVCILLKLGTKETVKMSGLSRQWRHAWAQIPDLEFDGVESSVPARVLAAYKAHGGDDIQNLTVSPNQVNVQDTTAWMSLAAPLLSGRLHFDNRRTVTRQTRRLFLAVDEYVPIGLAFQLPYFKKATEISMDLGFLALAMPLPPTGVFNALRVMLLEHFSFRGQISISDTMFPSLQRLTIRKVRGLAAGLTVNSKSLLYIHLSLLLELKLLNILAPELNKLEVTFCFYNEAEPVASIAAERLEELWWEVPCVPELKEMPHLRVLRAPPITTLWSKDICAEFLNCFPTVNHLELQISLRLRENGSLLSMKDTTIPNVNILRLYLEADDHVFEGRVLQMLTKCSGIKELNLSFQSRDKAQFDFQLQRSCLPGCICHDESGIWGDGVVPIRGLEIVKIINFHGAPREVNFVEELVRRSPTLKLLRVTSKVEDDSLDHIEGICPPGCKFEIVVVQG